MSGCDWQKKSFSVGASVIDNHICFCGLPSSKKYNGEWLCDEHFNEKCKSKEIGVFNTERDLRWNFISDIGNRQHFIHSKRQYQRLCKENNLISASSKELKQEAIFRKRLNAEDDKRKRGKFAKHLAGEMRGEVLKDFTRSIRRKFNVRSN